MIAPNKNFGQHFLHNKTILQKIVDQANVTAEDRIVEIGPGTGNLTRTILESNVSQLYAIEKDHRFMPILQEIKDQYSGRFDYVIDDATNFDFSNFPQYKLISNLPYNIVGYLCKTWILNPRTFQHYVITIQREMADRILSEPDSKTYGKLSIMMQIQFQIHQALQIKRTSFFPAPKVDSTVLAMTPLQHDISSAVMKALLNLLDLVFSSRRKKIYNLLRTRYSDRDLQVLKDLDLHKRPENFSVQEFLHMVRSLHTRHL